MDGKKISSNSFRNKITYKLFPYKSDMYNHLNECKHMTGVKLLVLHSNTWNLYCVQKKFSLV